jgi:nicotinamidase-related amidase
MPTPTLTELLQPGTCALVTQEVQGGVVGPEAGLPMLAEEARREALPNIERLVHAARAAGVQVIHCVIVKRPDGRGTGQNCRLYQMGKRFSGDLNPGSAGATVLPELGPHVDDIVLTRSTGIGPMGGTDLDAVLRNLAVRTIVAVGVSVNVAIPNFVMDAVNHGYQAVLPRDAVAGVPRDYAESVIDNTLALLATVMRTEDLLDIWAAAAG